MGVLRLAGALAFVFPAFFDARAAGTDAFDRLPFAAPAVASRSSRSARAVFAATYASCALTSASASSNTSALTRVRWFTALAFARPRSLRTRSPARRR